MSLHIRALVRYPDDNIIPVEPFAILEMALSDDGDYYYPRKVHLIRGDEVKFRKSQIERTYERTRSIPYLIIAHIVETEETPTYDLLERLPEIRNWKCMVCWQSVVNQIQTSVYDHWSAKTAGYNGPFTAG